MKSHFVFFWISLSFMAGICCHFWGFVGVQYVPGAVFCAIMAAYLFRQKKCFWGWLIVLVFFLLGWLCAYSRWLFPEDHIYFQRDQLDFSQISLRGIVDGDIKRTQGGYASRSSFVLSLRQAMGKSGWQKVSGKVLVNLFQDLPLGYGDEIILRGKLHRPFEFSKSRRFSYRQYLKRQGILYVLSVKKQNKVDILGRRQGHAVLSKLYRCRNFAGGLFRRDLDVAESSLMQAMLLGERLNIPASLKEVFAKTGTAHILAISGLNVGIVVIVLFFLLRMVPGPAGITYGLTAGFVVLYVFLTGASPSVVRAGIMAVVFLTGFVIERETNGINSLSFAAFLILLLDPQNVFDIGFQLSFASVLAILLIYPPLMKSSATVMKRYPSKIFKFILETFAVSLAANVGVGGLIAYYFQIVTPVSLLANLIVVPLSTLATILGIGMLLSAGFIPFFAICIQFVLNLMVWFMAFFEKFPFGHFYFQDVNIWNVISYYCCLIAVWRWFDETNSSAVH